MSDEIRVEFTEPIEHTPDLFGEGRVICPTCCSSLGPATSTIPSASLSLRCPCGNWLEIIASDPA